MPSWAYEVIGVALTSNVELAHIRPPAGRTGLPLSFTLKAAGEPFNLADWELLYQVQEEQPPPVLQVATEAAGECILLRFPGYVDFIVDGGRAAVTAIPTPTCPRQKLEQLLIDQVLPAMLYARGYPVFHASAVQLPSGGVVALMGPAGRGKSSLCAAMIERGAMLVCDDTLAVRVEDERVRVRHGCASLRIWPDTTEALLGSADALPPLWPHTTKRRMDRPLGSGPLYLKRVLLLEPEDGALSVEPLSRHAAVGALAPHVKRLDPYDTAALDAEFQLLADLAARVPVATLRYPHRWSELDRVLEHISAGELNDIDQPSD